MNTTPLLQVAVLLLLSLPARLALPASTRTLSRRPKSVSMFSPAAAISANPWLYSKAFSNGHIASALNGGGAYHYHPLAGSGLGAGLASYSGYNRGVVNGFATGLPMSTSYENYQSNHLGLGHSVSSRKSSYVSNNYGYPTLGSSYEHSTNVYGGNGFGGYMPVGGAKYGQYGSYDHFGFGSRGTYAITPGYTHISHTQTVPNYIGVNRVNKLRGYGK